MFGIWLELAGLPALHGAAVDSAAGALGLLGASGAGKSTLAAAFLRRGHCLLTDDLIPLEGDRPPWIVQPGVPFAKFWPDSGNFFWPDFERFEKVHDRGEKRKTSAAGGRELFARRPRPLRALYVLARGGDCGAPTLEALPPAQALLTLMGMRLAAEIVDILDPASHGLRALAALVEMTPVKLLRYASGLEALDDVSALVLADCGIDA